MPKKKLVYSLMLSCFSLAVAPFVSADPLLSSSTKANDYAERAAERAYLGKIDLGWLIAYIIQVLLGFLAVIFLVLMVYAGYNWMMARGNEEKVNKSLATIRMAIIGLIIVLGAYAISYFVFTYLPFSGGTLQGATVM